MGRPSKRAKRIREASEFSLVDMVRAALPPRETTFAYAWTLDEVAAARRDQQRGNFRRPAELAASVKTDAACFSALNNRLAPLRSLPVELRPANSSARAKRIADEAEALFGAEGVGVSAETMVDLGECLVQHGLAVGINVATARPDGSRVDLQHHAWPISRVRWSEHTRCLEATLEDGTIEPIQHANGRWTVYSMRELRPWQSGSIVPAALVWADRAFGIRDRSNASVSHGNAKWIGELPPGVPTDGPQAREFLEMLALMHQALPYGIRPSGAKTEMIANTSTAWQIFQEIVKGGLEDAARIYNGHDGTIKASGGNYVKDGFLFGVSVDLVEGDLRALERGFRQGTIEPWAALNFGDSSLAPTRAWLMPDADVDQRAASEATRRAAFWSDLELARAAASASGVVNVVAWLQQYAEESAPRFGVPVPQLRSVALDAPTSAAPASPTTPQQPAPSADVLRLPAPRRARHSLGS